MQREDPASNAACPPFSLPNSMPPYGINALTPPGEAERRRVVKTQRRPYHPRTGDARDGCTTLPESDLFAWADAQSRLMSCGGPSLTGRTTKSATWVECGGASMQSAVRPKGFL